MTSATGSSDRSRRPASQPSKAALGSTVGENVLRLIVGRWDQIRNDKSARLLEEGPARSGVFAQPVERGDGYQFELLRPDASVARTLGPGGGLVAATRAEAQAPAWEVTGTDDAGLDRAVALVRQSILRNRFALATDGAPIALPIGGDSQ